MISVKQLLSRSVVLLRENPVLLVPPLAADVLIAMIGPSRFGGMVLAALIQLAIMAGWLHWVATAHAGEKATWDGFFTSIGRHFWSLVGGALNQVLLMLAIGFPLMMAGALWVGQSGAKRLETELRPFLEGKAEVSTLATALSPEAMQVASQLMLVAMLWFLAFAVMSVVLVYWQQAIVVKHLGWLQAWRDSARVLRAHFKGSMALLTLLALAQGGAFLLALLMPGLGVFAAALAAVALLLARVYSGVATTLFYVEALRTTDDTPPSSPVPQA